MTHARRNLLVAAAAAAACRPSLVRAQEPAVPPTIKIIVVVPPGATMDAVARLVAERLKESLQRTVIVDYKTGGTGLVAAQYLKSAEADGANILFAPMAVASFFPFLYPRLPYDADRDLVPVTNGVDIPVALVVSSASPVQNLQQLLARAKADPLAGNVGTSSMSSVGAMVVHRLRQMTGTDLQLVAYKGGQPLVADLLGQQVPAGVSVVSDYLTLHRAGRLRILATSGKTRSPLAPDLPTLIESGYPDVYGVSSIGFFVRGGTPDPLVELYAARINEILKQPAVRTRLLELGAEPAPSSPAEFRRLVASERARWEPVARAANMRVE